MENYRGDLADIIRAGGGSISETLQGNTSSTTTSGGAMTDSWQFQTDPIMFDDFGHPFSSLSDPLLLSDQVHDLSGGSSSFFSNSNNLENDTAGFCGAVGNNFVASSDHQHQEIKKPNNYFSRMLQISPNNANLSCDDSRIMVGSPRLLKVPSSTLISSNDHMISGNSSKAAVAAAAAANCLNIENTGLQISSPRNTGIKRRKSQAKKVVCIPAPTPANSRPTGEIVPSDLWAWRKYGQKPIKGSPYPRGYYRCSSSKGCSARKQVERSRTDPNMLVITYTSEHNHPWPTQRNALAGSTRTQPAASKNSKTSPTADSQSHKSLDQLSNAMKEERKEINNDMCTSSPSMEKSSSATVKVEEDHEINHDNEDNNRMLTEMEDCDQFSKGFPPFESYRPTMAEDSINHINPDQDFFADLGEIESDPLNLLFIQGFDEKLETDKTLDPFTFYDWTGNTSNNINNKSFGDQAKS